MAGTIDSPQAFGKIPSLDGLRAVSVAIVMAAHAGFGAVVPGGYGVTVFFFLSGYLITTLLLAERAQNGTIDIAGFYVRRLLRLMPALLVTLTVAYVLVALRVIGGGISWSGLAAQVFYFANYYFIFFDKAALGVPAGTVPLWSLAVEEHFYIVYPILFARIVRARTLAWLLAGVCLAVLLWRIHLAGLPGFEPVRSYYASDTRIDGIIFGALLALVRNPLQQGRDSDSPIRSDYIVVVAALAITTFTFVYRDLFFRETFRYTMQGLALMPMFYFCIRFHRSAGARWLNVPWITKIGQYSYAIYLIHFVAIEALAALVPTLSTWPVQMLVAASLVAAAFAAGIDTYVDPLFKALRHKYRRSATPAGVAVPGA
jgi:peptidoglycan/LPS O-acetylase OafA/YrhL